MLRIIGLGMILVSGTGCGFALSSRLTRRKRNLEMILRMLILLKGEIRYGNTALDDAFTSAAGKLEGKYREFFLNTAEEIKKKKGKPFGEIFRSCARESLDDQNFTREEKEKIFSLGERLGYLGMDMQLRQLQLLEEDLENEIQELNKDLKEKKKLYQSLGILLGILLAVLVA